MKAEKIPVLINLLAMARYHQMPDYPMQMMMQGRLTFHDSQTFDLQYAECIEDEDTGENVTSDVVLTAGNGRLTMIRSGVVLNTMVFVRNQRFEGVYRTPYGEMNMAVDTREFSCRVTPERGEIHLKYLLYFDGSYASTNELHMEFFAESAVNENPRGETTENTEENDENPAE